MYLRILLAYDGSLEGGIALREGALLAKRCGAHVLLLSIIPETAGLRVADGVHAMAVTHELERFKAVLDLGVARLRQFGLEPDAELVMGEPALMIGAFARKISADLVVLGHRRQSLLERWWSGSTGAYVSDQVQCSVLVARNPISDEAFAAAMTQAGGG